MSAELTTWATASESFESEIVTMLPVLMLLSPFSVTLNTGLFTSVLKLLTTVLVFSPGVKPTFST